MQTRASRAGGFSVVDGVIAHTQTTQNSGRGEVAMDEAEIRSKVEQRKQRAAELGIVPWTRTLYLDYLRHYPDWAQNSPQYIYPGISNLQFATIKNGTVEVLSVQINGAEYLFNFETTAPFAPPADFWPPRRQASFLTTLGTLP